ncbi:MAG TPA: hypothetical protein DHI91_01700 [Candidatus Portnoybacteria bacterium]|nr:hypothetical protein [Candidatus Portnoybacteria bacterium]
MYWFLLSLGSALSKSLADMTSKKVLEKMGKLAVGCISRGMVAFAALVFVFFQGIPSIGPGFWKAVLITGAINVVTTLLSLRSLQEGELSLVAPMLALSPIFLLITSPIITNQFPSFWGLVGILLSVSGIYTMKVQETRLGWSEPFKAIWRSAGVKDALLVAFLYSISANYDSIAANSSSPFFTILMVNTFIFLCLFIPALNQPGLWRLTKENFKGLSLMSVFMASETGFQFTAFQHAIVPYVISVKRSSALLSVLWGRQFFEENKEFVSRLAGVAIVIAGLVIIKLFG